MTRVWDGCEYMTRVWDKREWGIRVWESHVRDNAVQPLICR